MNPLDLIHVQLELECIGTDDNNILYRIPGDNPDDIARFCVAHHTAGYVTLIRYDVAPRIVKSLRSLPPQQAFEDIEMVKRILEGETSHVPVNVFRSYYFLNAPSPNEYGDVIRQGDRFIVLIDGKPISWAWSSRNNLRAAELATETKPEFRRRGYARQVCSAWARYQLEHVKIAFYSHRLENAASEALAKSLGVIHFVDYISCG